MKRTETVKAEFARGCDEGDAAFRAGLAKTACPHAAVTAGTDPFDLMDCPRGAGWVHGWDEARWEGLLDRAFELGLQARHGEPCPYDGSHGGRLVEAWQQGWRAAAGETV